MQYLLSQEELNNLVPVCEVEVRNCALAKARDGILRLSNYACPATVDDGIVTDEGWCDNCPIVKLSDTDFASAHLLCPFEWDLSQ